MALNDTALDLSSVEWSWSFWLILHLPAMGALAAGLYSGAKQRSFRANAVLMAAPLACLSLMFWLLWSIHIERIEQAKIDYFMKYENPPTFSWTGSTLDEPVFDDWSTPGDKGWYVQCKSKDGSLYSRPPHWVWVLAPVYCIAFWSTGFWLMSAWRKRSGHATT